MSERVSGLLGSPIASRRRVSRGYTPAERWVVTLVDGRTAFVKAAVDDLTAGWLRAEHRAYSDIAADYMPLMLAWEDGTLPMLILEDLSAESWPPPWSAARVEAVLSTLERVAVTPAPAWLAAVTHDDKEVLGWQAVADDPRPLLGLGLCTSSWLEEALPALIAASAACEVNGSQLIHFDVRSDNICLRGESALLVDWNLAMVGNPRLDIAFWLPSLRSEGGPSPETVLTDAAGEAAVVSGFFAARAGLGLIPKAPHVREVQRRQLTQALPWVCRELSLSPPIAVP